MEQSRFVCKLCYKRYPCGKSLGGHMRSHVVAANSAESEQKFEPSMKKMQSLNDDKGGPSGYGLRENPRKTWRAAVDSTLPLPQEKVCKQCGKGFQSLKALCGHMACHSEKDRGLKDDHSWTSENHHQKLVTDSHSDIEAEDLRTALRSSKRSKNKRYSKRIAVKSASFSLANNNDNNDSSSVSEIDEQEQEEVAMCLMMLSKDSGNWAGVNSVVESSDNNSVILETKSSSIDMKIGRREGFNGTYSDKKLRSIVLDAESVQFENSHSGYLRNAAKRVESDISVDELLRNGGYRKSKSSSGARFEVFDAELGNKEFNRDTYYEAELQKDLLRGKGNESRKRMSGDGCYNPESPEEESSKNVHKRSKYECLNCNKTFNSYQGLGGHRPCYRKSNASFNVGRESGENSIEGDFETRVSLGNKKPIAKDFSYSAEKRVKPKKSKGHECPVCFRVFKSGQALGGHKRSHFIGGSEDKINLQTPESKQEVEIPDLIDLNLPAPIEDEDEGIDLLG